MMAALNVFHRVGQVADIEFLATEVLPSVWSFSLGPLLDLNQFKAFMDVIKALSAKIEREQIKKLQGLGSSKAADSRANSSMHTPFSNGVNRASDATGTEDNFEKLVLGNKAEGKKDPFGGALSDGQRLTQNPPSFSWHSVNPASRTATPMASLQPQAPSRSVTPDVLSSAFPSLQPAVGSAASIWGSTQSQPMQPQVRPLQSPPLQPPNYTPTFGIAPLPSSTNVWTPQAGNTFQQNSSSYAPPILAPPPPPPSNTSTSTWQQQPNYNMNSSGTYDSAMNTMQAQSNQSAFQAQPQQQTKTGLDNWKSLL